MKTVRLLFWCGLAYGILLLVVRGALPTESSPTLLLVAIPLVVIAVIIARDLARRSTTPVVSPAIHSHASILKEDPVQFLTGQIRVASVASDSYFENIVRARLKELLISKVSLETGSDRDMVRRALSDPREGPRLLHDELLYSILYGAVPTSGSERMRKTKEATELIGEWKG